MHKRIPAFPNPPRRQTALFALLLGAQAALPPLSIDISLPALPETGRALGASPALLQSTLWAFLVGFAAGQSIVGPFADRLGRRVVLLSGLFLFIVAGIGCAIAHSATSLTAWRTVQGAGACAGMVASRATVRDLYAEGRAETMQSVLSVVSTCAMLGAPIVGGAILYVSGWRTVYAALPIAGSLLLVCSAVFIAESRPDLTNADGFRASYAAVFRNAQVVAFAVVNALVFAGMFAFISAAPLVLITTYGVDPRLFGVLFAIPALALLAGATVAGRLAQRVSSAAVRRIGWVVLALAVACCGSRMAFGAGAASLLAALSSYTFAAGVVMPSAIARAMVPLPQNAGAAAGAIGALQFAAGAVAAAVVGQMAPGSVDAMLGIIIVLALGALLVGLGSEWPSNRHARIRRHHGPALRPGQRTLAPGGGTDPERDPEVGGAARPFTTIPNG